MSDITTQMISAVTLLGTAMVAVPLFKKLGLGSVLGYLAGGLIIGPFGLGLFHEPETIMHFAELGVVMFLFLIGLEMKPAHLWSLRKQILGLGLSQVLLGTALMTLVGMVIFGASAPVAFVCSAGFVLTSSAIVMQVLGERGQLGDSSGQRIVSILLFEDLMIVPLLAIVAFLSPIKAGGDTPIWQSIGIVIAAVAVLVLLGKFLLNPLFSLLAKAKAREIMTGAALFVVLGSALIMQKAGLSMAMGAFLAGVLLSESSFRHQLEADIEPFRGLLLGLFFLGVGMSLDLSVVLANWQIIIAGVALLMLTKGACVFIVAKSAKHPTSQAIERSVLMSHGGEFAFVLFSSAAAQGVISGEVGANMTAVIVLSMVMMSLLNALHQKFIAPKFRHAQSSRDADEINEENPIIIIGMGRYGQIVSDVLLMSGQSLTIIDKDERMVNGMTNYGVKTHFGDGTRPELLHSAGITQAKMLIVATDDKHTTSRIVSLAHELNPKLKIIARTFDRVHNFDLYQNYKTLGIRETFYSALQAGRVALEQLGMNKQKSQKISDLFNRRDHYLLQKLTEHYDPNKGLFQNRALMQASKAYDDETRKMIEALLRDEMVLWTEDLEDEEWATGELVGRD